MTKLDNCPCCGSKSEIIEVKKGKVRGFCIEYPEPMYKGSCTKCGLRTCASPTKKSVEKTWNRRKPIDKMKEHIEAVLVKDKDYQVSGEYLMEMFK